MLFTDKFLGDCPNVTLMGITASSGVNQNNGGYENAKTIFSIDNYDREAMEKGKIVFKRDGELEYAVRYLLNRY